MERLRTAVGLEERQWAEWAVQFFRSRCQLGTVACDVAMVDLADHIAEDVEPALQVAGL